MLRKRLAKTPVIDYESAKKIADEINRVGDKENTPIQIITPEQVLKLRPIPTNDVPNSCNYYDFRWGDVVIGIRLSSDGTISVRKMIW